MTTYTPANLPSNINTVERLALWSGLLLSRLNPTLSVLEVANATPEKAAQISFFRAADNSLRVNIRLSIPIDGTYETQVRKFWENAQELSNTAIPTAFTSN